MKVYLGLGSNLENRKKNITVAIELLKKHVQIKKISPIYESPALLPSGGDPSWNQPFLNLVLQAETTLSVEKLHVCTQEIEAQLGRKHNRAQWSPRKMDIDILAIDDQMIQNKTLTVPHPSLLERDFVLAPFRDISSDLMVHQQSILSHYRKLDQKLVAWMDIFNITPDSFSDGGELTKNPPLQIQEKIQKNINHYVQWFDVGGYSTRPEASKISPEEEWQRVSLFFDAIQSFPNHLIKISIDTFRSDIARKALLRGASAINDVSGLSDPKMISILREFSCDYILMHSLTVPADRNITLNTQKNPTNEIKIWLEKKLDYLQKNGIDLSRVIFDPGIGFGKTADQSLQIIQEIELFLIYPVRILVGHSRKSFMSIFSKQPAKDRLAESIGISLLLAQKGVDMIRVHQAFEHTKAWLAFKHGY